MSQPQTFINKFATGATENSNIGIGTMVGINTYDKKGVLQLAKDTIQSTYTGFANFGSMPKFVAIENDAVSVPKISTIALTPAGTYWHLYYSSDLGQTWYDSGSGFANDASHTPHGLIYYEGYYLLFIGTYIWQYTDPTSPSGSISTTMSGLADVDHPTFIFPNDNAVYFGNGNLMGRIGKVGTTTFNPNGTIKVDYTFSVDYLGFALPASYNINCISFLLPNYLALGTGGVNGVSQIADVVLWNPTLSTYETPLRLYTRGSSYGISQIINRNNTLYAVTSGNMALYETNGVNFSLIADFSLRSNIRKVGGTESNLPVFIFPQNNSITLLGNKMLIGMGTPASPNYPSNYGLFPCGIWTVAFADGGGIGEISYGINGTAVQCEYVISTNTTVATNASFQIGFILPITGNSAIYSWTDGTNYGIDYTSTTNFQNNIGSVIIESEMMEIGSPVTLNTIGNLQWNLVRNLMTGQTLSTYYRTGFDQDFTAVASPDLSSGVITGTSSSKSYFPITGHQIGQTNYLQFQLHMATVPTATDATIATYTPQLRNFIIGNPQSK